jgi:hypothetical protein
VGTTIDKVIFLWLEWLSLQCTCVSHALRVGEPDREDMEGDETYVNESDGDSCGDALARVCWVRLSSVRASVHPCVCEVGGDGGLRGGVLHARRLAGRKISKSVLSSTGPALSVEAELTERVRLGMLVVLCCVAVL